MARRPMVGPHPRCDAPSCVEPSRAYSGGWCPAHDARMREGRSMETPLRNHRKHITEPQFCREVDCDALVAARRMCSAHYYRWMRDRKAAGDEVVCAIPLCLRMVHGENRICAPHRSTGRQYGMTPDAFEAFWGDGKCRACSGTQKLSVDHDHSCCPVGNARKCGKCNRGLLCHSCNLAVGMAQDSPEILRSLADYLESSGR